MFENPSVSDKQEKMINDPARKTQNKVLQCKLIAKIDNYLNFVSQTYI